MTEETPQIGRRRFLISGAALLGAGALGLPVQADDSPKGAPAVVKSKLGLEALRIDLKGRMLFPADEGFAMAAFPNNARWADVKPRAIAMCADAGDVQQCVKWLRDNPGMPFAIRSGGHNYAGYSTIDDGLLIDVKAMNGVRLDLKEGTVTLAGGVNNQNMADAMRYTSVAVPSGRCPTVGASGLVLGGGWGFSATHAGLTCDSLLSTDIVLASGEQVTATAKNPYQDLFWGLRGGGGGNFGVNTSFTFRLHEVGKVTIFNITWPAQKQRELMMLLQKIQILHAPTTISTRTKIVPNRPGPRPRRDELMVTTLGQFFGDTAQLMEVLAPAYSLLAPLHQDIRTLDYWQARDYLITDDPTGMYDIRSSYVAETMPEQGIETMMEHMSLWPGGSLLPENMGILFAIGGKVKEVDPRATAYVHRKSNFIFEMERSWSPIDRPEVVGAQKEWLDRYWNAMKPFVLPESYVNFPSRELTDWQRAYYGDNLGQLKSLKYKYDRGNLFRYGQSIPLP